MCKRRGKSWIEGITGRYVEVDIGMKYITIATSVVLSVSVVFARAPKPKLDLRHRWVYVSVNMLVDKNVESTLKLLERVAKADYTGIVLTDSKFMRWDNLPDKYLRNVRRVRAACRRLKLDCIACVCPIGYSNSLLARDPNLAAGLPVKDAPFVVKDGKLIPTDESVRLVNGSFEQHRRNMPTGWRFADEPGKISFIDRDVKFHGKKSLRMQDINVHHPKHGNGRVMQTLKVKPFRYYHVSAAVKTKDFAAANKVRILVLAKGGVSLNYYQPKIAKTQGWKRIHITFNSLEFDEVNLYLGVWGGKGGKIWWDDVRIEPAGLVNVVRRKGAPLSVKSLDGKVAYLEGRDFAAIHDPLLGRLRYSGQFTVWHNQPTVKVPPGSRLKDGQTVLVSYYHTALIHWGQVMCCMSEPKVYEILDWQVRNVRKALDPDGYFMQHDEIRVHGWDESCTKQKMTPGEILADNVARCTAIIRKHASAKPIYVWSDMFDPHHNARRAGRYYLVKGDGPWHDSWKGLGKDVTVVNWHGHAKGRTESLKHFAERGHKQILAGYYDADPARIAEWLAEAAKVKGVVGVMYTTWRHNYDDLEKFAAEINKFRRLGK